MSGASTNAGQGSHLVFQAKTDAEPRETDAATSRKPAIAGAWSARRTLCFIMLTCGAFWAVVAALLLG